MIVVIQKKIRKYLVYHEIRTKVMQVILMQEVQSQIEAEKSKSKKVKGKKNKESELIR